MDKRRPTCFLSMDHFSIRLFLFGCFFVLVALIGCGGGGGGGGDTNRAPAAVVSATPASGNAPLTVTFDGTASSDPDGDSLTYTWNFGEGSPASGGTASHTYLQSGTYTASLTVSDGNGGEDSAQIAIQVNALPSAAFSLSPDAGNAPLAVVFDASASQDSDGSITGYAWDFGDSGSGTGANPSHTYTSAGSYTIVLTVTDDDGASQTASTTLVVGTQPAVIPPDPSTKAPALDPMVATPFEAAVRFLYTDTDPIQTDVDSLDMDPERLAVLRGRVLSQADEPLAGVAISILNHPEFGQTLSRDDGLFDLAVNGGAELVIEYKKSGYLTSQRRVSPSWREFVWAPDVVMVAPAEDEPVTVVDLTGGVMQVARGSQVSDGRGDRQSTLMFSAGTQASMVLADGSTQSLSVLDVSVVEYSVGANGPSAMPAELPPGTGYTYAAELGVAQARDAGAVSIRFDQPVINYVENFIGFPVGDGVPAFYYNRERGTWEPTPDGRVVEITGIDGDIAELDIDGDGSADDSAALSALGVSDDERRSLASLYSAGQSLWRVPVHHFSPVDYNWPYEYDEDDWPPVHDELVDPDDPFDFECPSEGSSTIGCQSQVLGEAVGLSGTPYKLVYSSDRVPGRKDKYRLEITLSQDPLKTVNPLDSIELTVSVAGQLFEKRYDPLPGQTEIFVWDGRDAYGRKVQGAQPVVVRVGYRFLAQRCDGLGRCMYDPTAFDTLWREWRGLLGGSDASELGWGGWTLNVHHRYDPVARVVRLGDGGQRSAEVIGPVVRTIGQGDRSWYINGLDVAADGALLFPDASDSQVFRMMPGGNAVLAAGCYGTGCNAGFGGDGGPATEAILNYPMDVAVAPDGSFFIADSRNHRVRRVDADGIITTFAGTGTASNSGDGGPAGQAGIVSPMALALSPDGTLYVLTRGSSNYHTVRRIGTDGIIQTVFVSPPGVSDLYVPMVDIALDPEGNLMALSGRYTNVAAEGQCSLFRVTPNGQSEIIAGNGTCDSNTGDGGPAVDAALGWPRYLAVDRLGAIYMSLQAQSELAKVRRIDPDGSIALIWGCTQFDTSLCSTSSTDIDSPAIDTHAYTGALAIGPEDHLYLGYYGRFHRYGRGLSGYSMTDVFIPSLDGRQAYVFDVGGRHLRTIDTLTGEIVLEFSYGSNGRLASITDGDGNVTEIGSDRIRGPYGHETYFSFDGNGYLSGITGPSGARTFTYTDGGLLIAQTDPNQNTALYEYDALGRLIQAMDDAGGSQTLVRVDTQDGYAVTRTTGEGRTYTHSVASRPEGGVLLQTDAGCCGVTEVAKDSSGNQGITAADGTVMITSIGPDPRFGMGVPLTRSLTVNTPGGLSNHLSFRRSAVFDPRDPLILTSQTDTLTVNGKKFTSLYDSDSRTFTNTTPEGRERTLVIDGMGRKVYRQTGDLEPLSNTYDDRGRLSSIAIGDGGSGGTFSLTYDSNGRVASITDPSEQTTFFTYDSAGRVTQQAMPGGRTIQAAYDDNGNLISLTPPGRSAHLFTYSAVNRPVSYLPPDSAPGTLYETNLDRQLTRVTRADLKTVQYTRDSAGRVSVQTTDQGSTTYAYDPSTQNLSMITAPDGNVLSLSYDGRLLTGMTWSGTIAGSVGVDYDNYFRVSSLTVNEADAVAYLYDGDGLSSQAGNLALTRDAVNGLITGTAIGNVTSSLVHDGYGHVISRTESYDGTPIFAVAYVYDDLGRIVQKTETVDATTTKTDYTFDNGGRLTGIAENDSPAAAITYDANGNRLTFTDINLSQTDSATYDGQDRMLTYAGATYAYSAAGDLQTKTVGTDTTAFQYDVLGNLVRVDLPNTDVITYVVDGANRRIGKKVNNSLVQGFLYQDGLRPIAELDGGGSLVSRFVYLPDRTAPSYMIKSGATYCIVSDHLGSPRMVVNVATGQVVQRMDYDAFGRVINDTNPGFQPFGFAGGLYDPDTGLTRFGARDYDAATGRFTTKDPILFSGGQTNLYAYCLNDPVNLTDPSGRFIPAPIIVAAAPIITAIANNPNIVGEAVDFVANAAGIPGWQNLGETNAGAAAGTALNEAVTQIGRAIEEAMDLYEARQQEEMLREINTELLHEGSEAMIGELEELLELYYELFCP